MQLYNGAQTGYQAAEMARAAGAVDVARMSVVVHANLESEEQVGAISSRQSGK